eukprot:3032912-Rhodomonas_salina.1
MSEPGKSGGADTIDEGSKPHRRSGGPQDSADTDRPQKQQRMTLASCWCAASWEDRGLFLLGVANGERRYQLTLCYLAREHGEAAIGEDYGRIERCTLKECSGGGCLDCQWNTLRKFFPLLGGGLVLHVTISSIFKRLEEKRSGTRAWFYAVTGVVFVLVLH